MVFIYEFWEELVRESEVGQLRKKRKKKEVELELEWEWRKGEREAKRR